MSFARTCEISIIAPICPSVIHRTKPADDPRLCSFQSWQNSPSWPTRTWTSLLSLELSSLSPPFPAPPSLQAVPSRLFQTLWDDWGSRWPARMNEGLRHGGMNFFFFFFPIFTTTEAFHDRCLPTGQRLLVRRTLGKVWTSVNYGED